ncbi:hypothetical protein [Kitasatospora phosalacinea]|uniref:Uncharacterized protein n=1 Tax=Kitasatospora phosalacinea TaxID=2065 RepID=A0ABW6GRB9_9ACTN
MTDNPQPYVWCFDHGRTHNFSDGAWCTAWWVPLVGATEPEALADKAARFGDARFYDQLPFAVQVELAEAREPQP